MSGKKYLIVMAAGHGTRMGGNLPKQFMQLDGKAILHQTILKFMAAVPDINVITVLPSDGQYDTWWRDYCISRNFNCAQILVRGGITRFHSVKAALARVPSDAIVAIHDGVRPLLSEDMIRSMFSRIENDDRCRALIPVIPMVDTLKILETVKDDRDNEFLRSAPGRSVDRSEVFGAQTPQIFRAGDIKDSYSQAYDRLFTDDASVADKYGIPLTFVKGERLNIKITSPEDMVLAEAIISISKG